MYIAIVSTQLCYSILKVHILQYSVVILFSIINILLVINNMIKISYKHKIMNFKNCHEIFTLN